MSNNPEWSKVRVNDLYEVFRLMKVGMHMTKAFEMQAKKRNVTVGTVRANCLRHLYENEYRSDYELAVEKFRQEIKNGDIFERIRSRNGLDPREMESFRKAAPAPDSDVLNSPRIEASLASMKKTIAAMTDDKKREVASDPRIKDAIEQLRTKIDVS